VATGITYRVHDFAALAGVTVKALHHYDRVGLLRPARSAAGYRLYEDRDLERLEQIVALKFLGLPLRQIKTLLDRDPLQLPAALRLQRTVLEDKRRQLDRAIEAITDAEKQPATAAALRKIIEALSMQTTPDFMKNYYREDAWQHFRHIHAEWPSEAWYSLFRDVSAALHQNPASEAGQSLAMRWRALRVADAGGDPAIHGGLIAAWADRRYWPEEVQSRLAAFNLDAISTFMTHAFRCWREKNFGDPPVARQLEQFAATEREGFGLARAGLYFLLAESASENPAGPKAQALAARWMELMETTTGYKNPPPDVYEAMIDRIRNWPPEFVQQLQALDREKTGKFLLKALEAGVVNR
jgi:DNA-binding transcriptional MerR regulator